MSESNDSKQNRYLFLFDFDGTIADTFSPSPNNIGVNEAYEGAIEEVFGSRGLKVYAEIGGLKNNAPGELVDRILNYDKSLAIHAQSRFFSKKHDDIGWDEDNPSKTITEFLIREKLRIFMKEIGPSWPEPFDGVVVMFEQIKELNENGINIDIGIVTSGHTEFVEKVLEIWGVDLPNISITDDDLRYKYPIYPLKENRLIKPSQTLFAIARAEWLRKHNMEPVDIDFNFAFSLHENVLYFGDDKIKDGEFAENSKLMFAHFDIGCKDGIKSKNEGITFSNWNELNKVLFSSASIKGMQDGKSIKEILRNITSELKVPDEKGKGIKMR